MTTDTLDADEDLRQLRKSAEDFARRASPLERARELRGTPTGYDRAFWRILAQQGWTGLLVPEECGGYKQGFTAAAVVIGALAGRLAPEPFVPAVVFAGRAIELSGSSQLHHELLAGLAAGEIVPIVAFEESQIATALDLEPRTVRAVKADNEWRVSGSKFNVRAAAGADGFVISSRTGDGAPALIWVPAGTPGVRLETRSTTDGGGSATVSFDEAIVPQRNLLSQGTAAEHALARAYDETLVMTSVELLGIQRAMFEMSLEYMRSRVQFNRAIGTFQALQHRAVDLLVQNALTEAALGEVIARLGCDSNSAERGRDASRVKARASAAALHMAKESIQFHGAIGFTDEYDLGLYVQRTIVLSAWLGNAWMHRRRYAQLNSSLECAQA